MPVEGAVPSEEHGRGEQGAKGHVAGDSGQVEGAAASLKVSVVRLSNNSRLCFVRAKTGRKNWTCLQIQNLEFAKVEIFYIFATLLSTDFVFV